MKLILCLFALASPAFAHEGYPISPVRARLSVEPDRIVAEIETDSIFWIEEVAHLQPMPPTDWPADAQARVEAYANSHFRLSADGHALIGNLASARYRQFPWEVNEEGTFFLRMVYPPTPPSGVLSVTASFYEEYRKEMAAEYGGRALPNAADYRTFLAVTGKRRSDFVLTASSPSFTTSIEEARRTGVQMAFESLVRGAQAATSLAAGFPALLAIALCLGAAAPGRSTLAILAAAASSGFVAGRAFVAPPWLLWAATLAASLAAGRWRRAPSLCASTAGCLGLVWYAATQPLLPHSALALPFSLLGALAGGAGLLAAARLGVAAERRRLLSISASRVEELFARRVRLAATALAMVAAYGLWQSLRSNA